MTARFLVVDDHPLFREALQGAILLAYPDAEVVEAVSVAAAQAVLAAQKPFDLLFLDLSMPGTTGFEGLLALRSQNPRLPIVVVSGLEDHRIVREALSYGIAGFVPKSVRKPALAEAVREVMSGAVYVPEGYAASEAIHSDRVEKDLVQRLKTLTPQQLRVLEMIRHGKLNKQISHELDVGETTVKAHVSEILRKLNVYSRTMAVIEVAKIDFDQILSEAGHKSERDA